MLPSYKTSEELYTDPIIFNSTLSFKLTCGFLGSVIKTIDLMGPPGITLFRLENPFRPNYPIYVVTWGSNQLCSQAIDGHSLSENINGTAVPIREPIL